MSYSVVNRQEEKDMKKVSKTNNLGERIKKLRLDNNMTQSLLAEKLYVSDKVISKWEKCKSIPDVDILLDLSEIFNVSIEYILTGKTNKPKDERIVHNNDGSINHYVGADGDRLFTRDEVTTILRKRLDRFKNSIFEKAGVHSEESLIQVVEAYSRMRETFMNYKAEIAKKD